MAAKLKERMTVIIFFAAVAAIVSSYFLFGNVLFAGIALTVVSIIIMLLGCRKDDSDIYLKGCLFFVSGFVLTGLGYSDFFSSESADMGKNSLDSISEVRSGPYTGSLIANSSVRESASNETGNVTNLTNLTD